MYRLITGDSLTELRRLPDRSVQCCVTSPPYWGLRDYGKPGQLGLESTPEEYVAKLVEVFREVKRVLRDDGTCWLNLGDSYVGGGGFWANAPSSQPDAVKARGGFGSMLDGWLVKGGVKPQGFLKPKDLVGIPWRVAFALQKDGWWLRQDIIWHKPNPMPESVKDRCTKAHEYIFLLTKRAKYYYDNEAIMEVATGYDGRKDTKFKGAVKSYDGVMPDGQPQSFAQNGHERWRYKNLQEDGQQPNTMHLKRLVGDEYLSPVRNRRSVWTIATKPYKEAHFATFPPALVEPCILAGSKPGDTILDPFSGAGTVGVVALRAGRHYIGVELNLEYNAMAERRIEQGLSKTALLNPT